VQTLAPFALPIVSITNPSNPCEIRVTAHGLSVGDTVTISGVTGGTFSPSINGTFQVVAVNSVNRFTVAVNCSSTTGINLTNATILSAITPTAARDRVRSVVHLLVTSPDFTIQK
jgi:DeoR/GlpR family transcriptional regulator of sugar metabolism